MKKESLSTTMPKLIMAVSLIVGIGAVLGVLGYFGMMEKSEVVINNETGKEEIKKQAENFCPSIVTDIDNNIYNTVKIGDQCWMKENLKVTKNPVGIAITRYCYDSDLNICGTDGGLYDWNTAMNGSITEGAQGICPNGWHIPCDSEWYELENKLAINVCTKERGRSHGPGRASECDPAGTKLKSGGSSSFEGTLVGFRFSIVGRNEMLYNYQNKNLALWSSTKNGSGAWSRSLDSSLSTVTRELLYKEYGLSIRCIKN